MSTKFTDLQHNVGSASPETMRSIAGFKTIQQDLVKAAEAAGVNIGYQFDKLFKLREGRNAIVRALTNSLASGKKSAISRKNTMSMDDSLAQEALITKYSEDITTIQDRLKLYFEKLEESVSFGGVSGFQQAVLPLLYLESIRNVSREIMPYKVVDSIEIPRVKYRNFLRLPNGDEYTLLEAFRSPAVMGQILNSSNIKSSVAIAFNTVNAINTIAGVTAKSIMPAAWISAVNYSVSGTPAATPLKTGAYGINDTAYASSFSRGKFELKVDVVDPGTKAVLNTFQINGKVDFEKATVQLSGFASNPDYTLDGAVIEVTFDGSDFDNVITPFLKTEDKITSVSKRLNLSVEMKKEVLKAALKLDQIDRSMEFTGSMYEICTNTKDYLAFQTVEDTWEALANKTIAETLESGAFAENFAITPGAAFRPVHPREWAAAELPNTMEKTMVKVSKKVPNQAGIQFTFYGDPEATTQVPSLKVMVGSDEGTYGGLKVENDVMFARIGKFNAKIVSTQRAVDTNYLQLVPYSNSENQETFSFMQFYTLFDTNNELRNPHNPLIPALNMIDIFDTDTIFPILGRVNFVG